MIEYEWTDYASNPDDGATIIRMVKEAKILKYQISILLNGLNEVECYSDNNMCIGMDAILDEARDRFEEASSE